MSILTQIPRASHVNFGTSVPHGELRWPDTRGPVFRNPKLHVEVDPQSTTTPYGGLGLAFQFLKKFKVAKRINERVQVLKLHLPYHESDHVQAQALNLYSGGTCIEDMANLQNSEAVRRMAGACRFPDPTTGGDFLRRFDRWENPGSLEGLRDAIDEVQEDVWKSLSRRRGRRRRKQPWAVVDVDAHLKEFYAKQKQGADFSYKGKWSYSVLMASLSGTGECLAIESRPGNVRGSDGAAEMLMHTLPRLKGHFKKVLVRADSDFDRKGVWQACEVCRAYFAFVGREFPDRPGIAEGIPEAKWRPFATRAARQQRQRKEQPGYCTRKKKRNLKKRRARQRGYKDLQLVRQWWAEVPWKPKGSNKTYRLIIRRQLIEHRQGQLHLFDEHRYRYIVTSLPKSFSAVAVIDETYLRCDQENIIEQMGSGLAAWRMPVAEFDGNCAWLEIARLAWNMAKWIAQLALPAEVVRWEWKRFRQAFLNLSAEVTKRGRQIWIRISASHRFHQTLVRAHVLLQT